MLLPQSVIRIVLDVREVEKQVSFTVTQSDTVRRLIINLCDKGKPYVIGKGCYAVFSAITSKGVGMARSCKIEGNEIIYDLTAADVATVGRMDCDITLFGASGESITSPGFLINVYKSKMVAQSGEIVASEDFTALQGLIGDVNERIAKIDDILESDGKTIEDAFREAISGIDDHAADVVESLPGTYVEVANDVEQTKKEVLTRTAGASVKDDGAAYIKNVPASSLHAAKINKVGGMTYKDGDELKSAPVTKIESVGVNLFDLNNRLYGAIDDNGDLYCNNVLTPFYRYDFKANTQYTLSGYVKNENTTGNVRLSIRYTDGSEDGIALLNPTTKWEYKTFTTQAGKTVDYIAVNYGNVGTMLIRDGELMLNEGSSALPYAPFRRDTTLIPEAVRNRNGYGESNNYIDFEKKQFVQRKIKDVFDGSDDEGWRLMSDGRFYIRPKNYKTAQGYVLSNKFTMAIWDGLYIESLDTGATNESELKTALAKNPLEVIYELAEPITTNISEDLPDNNLIEVEANGTITFDNENGLAVPSEIVYYLDAVSGVMADGTPALKVGDTIITQEQIKSLLNGAGGGSGNAARLGEVTILANKWIGASSPYSQVVDIAGVTENSQVDLTPSVEQLAVFHNKDLAFVTENEGGVVTVYAIGDKPTNDYTIQVTITEVEV